MNRIFGQNSFQMTVDLPVRSDFAGVEKKRTKRNTTPKGTPFIVNGCLRGDPAISNRRLLWDILTEIARKTKTKAFLFVIIISIPSLTLAPISTCAHFAAYRPTELVESNSTYLSGANVCV